MSIEHQNLGFQPDHLLTAGVTLDSARYKDAAQQTSFVRDIISRLQHIPGAVAVAVTSDLPATGPGSVTVQIKGEPDLPANQARSYPRCCRFRRLFQRRGNPRAARPHIHRNG